MNPDDGRFLSEFLDGQLDAERQHIVESALVSDARLADELRDLIVVRDLVSGLSRDHRVDVAPQVMERIHARRWFERLTLPQVTGWPGHRLQSPWARGVACAVIVLAVVSLVWPKHSGKLEPLKPVVASLAGVTEAAKAPTEAAKAAASPLAVANAALTPPVSQSRAASTPELPARTATPAPAPASVPVVLEAAPTSARTMEQLTALLDNKNLRQIFVVSNQKDGRTRERVASLVEQTTRFDFFTITIAQGVVIDPLHPEDATVFAMIVNPAELQNLRQQLEASLAGDVEERAAQPEIVTQLADIGQVKSFKPSAPGQVTIPRVEIAFRAESPNVAAAERPAASPELAATAPTSTKPSSPSARAEDHRNSPASGSRTIAGKDRASGVMSLAEARVKELLADKKPDKDESQVVLIWVRGNRSS